MPVKEFKCNRTARCRVFEKRFSTYKVYEAEMAIGKVLCPVCGKVPRPAVSKPAPPQFRGSGFHATDYGKG